MWVMLPWEQLRRTVLPGTPGVMADFSIRPSCHAILPPQCRAPVVLSLINRCVAMCSALTQAPPLPHPRQGAAEAHLLAGVWSPSALSAGMSQGCEARGGTSHKSQWKHPAVGVCKFSRGSWASDYVQCPFSSCSDL